MPKHPDQIFWKGLVHTFKCFSFVARVTVKFLLQFSKKICLSCEQCFTFYILMYSLFITLEQPTSQHACWWGNELVGVLDFVSWFDTGHSSARGRTVHWGHGGASWVTRHISRAHGGHWVVVWTARWHPVPVSLREAAELRGDPGSSQEAGQWRKQLPVIF